MCDRFEIRTLGGTSREGVGGKEGGGREGVGGNKDWGPIRRLFLQEECLDVERRLDLLQKGCQGVDKWPVVNELHCVSFVEKSRGRRKKLETDYDKSEMF